MSRSTVRSLFVTTLVVLVLQYGLVGIVGVYASEPWPAVVLPAFKSVYSTEGTFDVTQTTLEVRFANAPSSSISTTNFLSLLPRSHHSAFLQTQCPPNPVSAACQTPAGRNWFVNRARTLFPNRTVRSVDLVWSRLRFNLSTKRTTTVPLDTLHFSTHP